MGPGLWLRLRKMEKQWWRGEEIVYEIDSA